jgi:hypothetical protein
MSLNYSFIDAQENTWFIGIGAPKPTLAMHDGEKVYGWIVHIIAPDGKTSVEHQHNNLAEAIAQAVAKAEWLRK